MFLRGNIILLGAKVPPALIQLTTVKKQPRSLVYFISNQQHATQHVNTNIHSRYSQTDKTYRSTLS